MRWLRPPAYRVTVAESATDALAAAELDRPDLIISDILLHFRSGMWLLKEVRRRWMELPVILISGAPFSPVELEEIAEFKKAIFLQKPFTRLQLERAVGLVTGSES